MQELFSQENLPYILGLTVGGLASLVAILANLDKLIGYIKKFQEWKRTRFAIKQQPYCSKYCSISEIIPVVRQLQENDKARAKSDLLRDKYSLLKAAKEAIREKYLDEQSREVFIERLIDYLERGGNGPAQDASIRALRLPIELDGPATIFELSDIYPLIKT